MGARRRGDLEINLDTKNGQGHSMDALLRDPIPGIESTIWNMANKNNNFIHDHLFLEVRNEHASPFSPDSQQQLPR